MHVGTDSEVVQFLSDNKWDCGIKVDGDESVLRRSRGKLNRVEVS